MTFISKGKYDFPKMKSSFAKRAHKILPGALVTSSIDQHVSGLEGCIKWATAVYFPHIARAKREERMKVKGQPQSEKDKLNKNLNKIPEGIIINHYNSDTGKFNGHKITSKPSGESFKTFAKHLALKTPCNVPIRLYICVKGDAKFSDINGAESGLSYFYFRMVILKKIVMQGGDDSDLRTYPSLSATEKYDWPTIGFDADQHSKLRFSCIPTGATITAKTMKLDVIKDDCINAEVNLHEVSESELSSETFDVIYGQKLITHNVKDMPSYDDFQPWNSYTYLHKGANGRGKACFDFKFRGNKYRLPDEFFEKVLEWSGGGREDTGVRALLVRNTKVISNNKNGEHSCNFECKQPEEPGIFAPPMKKMRAIAAEKLPVKTDPIMILGGDQTGVKGNKKNTTIYINKEGGGVGCFNLPPSIRSQLRTHLGLQGAEDDLNGRLLTGFSILHTADFKGRVVVSGGTNNKSQEEMMIVCDQNGVEVARTVPRKRKRD
jgi:hypothetical protein